MAESRISQALIFVAVIAVGAASVGCGGDGGWSGPQETGIQGTWLADGDYLIFNVEGEEDGSEDGDVAEDRLPSYGISSQGDQAGTCETSNGLEVYPGLDGGPIFGSVDWATEVDVTHQFFEVYFSGNASAPSDPSRPTWSHNRTGDNAYILEITNDTGEALTLDTSWSVDADFNVPEESDELGEAAVNIDISSQIFTGYGDDCRDVSDEFDAFDVQFSEDREDFQEAGASTLEIDAERVKFVIYAEAGVRASTEPGSGSHRAANVAADFRVDVNF